MPDTSKLTSRQWYVVTSRPRQEAVACDNLFRQGYRAYLPLLTRRKRIRGKWHEVTEPLFPGYLFVALDLTQDDIAPIRSTIGARGLVRFGLEYRPMPSGSVEFLQTREVEQGASGPSNSQPFMPGDRVRFNRGPFAGLEAVYQMPRAQDRACLLITLLGRVNAVTAAMDDLEGL
jgi:transcriptional antiterminator RfaH